MKSVNARAGLAPSAVLFACLFAAQAAILVVSPILPQVADEFNVSTSVAAQLRAVSGITAGVAALILAASGDRFRLGWLLKMGLFLLAAGSLWSALAPNFAFLLAAQVVIGLGLALVLSGGLAASEAWAEGGGGARVLSWALVGQPVAWIVGQPVIGIVASNDWRPAWLAVPFVSSLAALASVALRKAAPNEVQECDPLGLWRLVGIKSWAWGELLAFSAWAGTLVYAGAFFIETYRSSVPVTGLILGLVAAAYLPGNFLGRRWLRVRSAGGPVLGFALAGAVAVALFGGVRIGVAVSTIILAVLAFFAGGRTIAGAALGLQLADGRRLAAMSVRTAMVQFGYLLGAAIGGVVLPGWGFAGVGWAFAGLFILAAAVHIRMVFGAGTAGYRATGLQLRRHQG